MTALVAVQAAVALVVVQPIVLLASYSIGSYQVGKSSRSELVRRRPDGQFRR